MGFVRIIQKKFQKKIVKENWEYGGVLKKNLEKQLSK